MRRHIDWGYEGKLEWTTEKSFVKTQGQMVNKSESWESGAMIWDHTQIHWKLEKSSEEALDPWLQTSWRAGSSLPWASEAVGLAKKQGVQQVWTILASISNKANLPSWEPRKDSKGWTYVEPPAAGVRCARDGSESFLLVGHRRHESENRECWPPTAHLPCDTMDWTSWLPSLLESAGVGPGKDEPSADPEPHALFCAWLEAHVLESSPSMERIPRSTRFADRISESLISCSEPTRLFLASAQGWMCVLCMLTNVFYGL